MHRRPQPQRARPQVDAGEGGRGHGLLVAAEAEAHDRREPLALVDVQHLLRGLRAPVPDGVEQDPAEDASLLERLLEPGVDRLDARIRVHPEARVDLGRDVHLGVANPGVRTAAGHGERGFHVVLGAAEEPADLGVEQQEALRVADVAPGGLERGEVREGMVRSGREPRDLRGRQAALEVEVAVGEERRRGVTRGALRNHDVSIAPFPIAHGPLRIHTELYMRRTRLLALFLDALVCAGAADAVGLASTALVWRLWPASRPAIPFLWGVLAAAATLAFLLRDSRGGRARRWLAIEVRRLDGRRPGAWRSI